MSLGAAAKNFRFFPGCGCKTLETNERARKVFFQKFSEICEASNFEIPGRIEGQCEATVVLLEKAELFVTRGGCAWRPGGVLEQL